MENKSKKTIIYSILIMLIITISLLGLTYAYYRTRIIGNPNNTSLSVSSKLLEVTYIDGSAYINSVKPSEGTNWIKPGGYL